MAVKLLEHDARKAQKTNAKNSIRPFVLIRFNVLYEI